MEEYKAYCDAVCAQLRRATAREKYQLRRELSAHLEDHACALMERDVPQEEAAARAVAAMGDPAEVGKALNAQLSRAWLLVGRGALALLLCAVLALALPLLQTGQQVFWNLCARWGVEKYLDDADKMFTYFTLEREEAVHYTARAGGYVVQINRLGLGYYEYPYHLGGGEGYGVYLVSSSYPQNPLLPPAQYLGLDFTVNGATGSGGGTFDAGASYRYRIYPVEYGAPELVIAGAVGEESFTLTIPLDWEGVS